jgi:desulfoferrodoxin (superoxide reductase-like protein)
LAAWHLFSESETKELLNKCRVAQITVNSFLLKHLDRAIRPEIRRPELGIPWMIPVNLRGDFQHPDDTANHVSCVEVTVSPDDSAKAIQKQILNRLRRGEHRANHLLLGLGKFLSHRAKVKFLRKDRSKRTGNIGAFSNLGVWDAEKKLKDDASWLFCPPVVKGQLLAAGCVTFQNRLGLTIQNHPKLPLSGNTVKTWMSRWVEGIREA